jgi:hypothetical protein
MGTIVLLTSPNTDQEQREPIDIQYGRDVQRLRDEGCFAPDEEPSLHDVAYHLVRVGLIRVDEDLLWQIRDGDDVIASNFGA